MLATKGRCGRCPRHLRWPLFTGTNHSFARRGSNPERPPRHSGRTRHVRREAHEARPETGELLQLGFLPGDLDWYVWAYPQWFGGALLQGGEIIARHPAGARCVRMGTRLLAATTVSPRFAPSPARSAGSRLPNRRFFAGKVAMQLQGLWLQRLHQAICAGARIWRGPLAHDAERSRGVRAGRLGRARDSSRSQAP